MIKSDIKFFIKVNKPKEEIFSEKVEKSIPKRKGSVGCENNKKTLKIKQQEKKINKKNLWNIFEQDKNCLLYTSDAADE